VAATKTAKNPTSRNDTPANLAMKAAELRREPARRGVETPAT
jgi:hypothetical protein